VFYGYFLDIFFPNLAIFANFAKSGEI